MTATKDINSYFHQIIYSGDMSSGPWPFPSPASPPPELYYLSLCIWDAWTSGESMQQTLMYETTFL